MVYVATLRGVWLMAILECNISYIGSLLLGLYRQAFLLIVRIARFSFLARTGPHYERHLGIPERLLVRLR